MHVGFGKRATSASPALPVSARGREMLAEFSESPKTWLEGLNLADK